MVVALVRASLADMFEFSHPAFAKAVPIESCWMLLRALAVIESVTAEEFAKVNGYTHTNTHTSTHTLTHKHMHAHTHTNTQLCTHTFTHTSTHAHTQAHIHTQAHMHTHKHTCTHTDTYTSTQLCIGGFYLCTR